MNVKIDKEVKKYGEDPEKIKGIINITFTEMEFDALMDNCGPDFKRLKIGKDTYVLNISGLPDGSMGR